MSKTTTTVPSVDDVSTALDMILAGDAPIGATAWQTLVTYGAGDRTILARCAYAVRTRGTAGIDAGAASIAEYARQTGRDRSRLSAMATAYGWLVDSLTPQTPDAVTTVVRIYEDGADARSKARAAVPTIREMAQGKRAAQWSRLRAQTAAAAKTARAAKTAPATAPEAAQTAPETVDVETAAVRVPAPADAPTTAADVYAALRAVAEMVGVGRDGADVALTTEQAAEISALALAIAETVTADQTTR